MGGCAVARGSWIAASLAVVLPFASAPAAPAARSDTRPVEMKQPEQVTVRLVQIDALISEKEPLGRPLAPADFELTVGGQTIVDFTLDRACGEPTSAPEGAAASGAGEGPAPATPPRRPAIVFVFDQTHLTMAGRDRAIETAMELVDRLIVDGARGQVVSSGRELSEVVALTEDRTRLKAGIAAMRKDGRMIDSYASTEEFRRDELKTLMHAGMVTTAQAMARDYATEEFQEVRRTKSRMEAVLGVLVDVPPPKGIVYFADTIRQEAGTHYLLLTGAGANAATQGAYGEVDGIIGASLGAGAHMFTVEAQGLLSDDDIRIRHAEDTLVSLAVETGGAAFLRNTPTKLMVDRIERRLGCPYIVSFRPAELPKDRPLAVSLRPLVPGVKVEIQGRVVVASESAILSARLLAAFASGAPDEGRSLRLALIPRGASGRKWQASLQVRVLPEASAAAGLDLGASIVQSDRVAEAVSNTIASGGRVRPVILEHAVTLAPGPFKIVGVAYDRSVDGIVSATLEGSWPDPGKGGVAIAPIAVLQTRDAAVSKDGEARSSISMAIDPDEAIDPAHGTAIRSVVCRGSKSKGPLSVDRLIEGAVKTDFAPMTLAPGDAECLEIVDVLRPAAATAALADYRIVVRDGDEVVGVQRRTLRFASPSPAPR